MRRAAEGQPVRRVSESQYLPDSFHLQREAGLEAVTGALGSGALDFPTRFRIINVAHSMLYKRICISEHTSHEEH